MGVWRGSRLERLKFALREVTLDSLAFRNLARGYCRLYTPDLKSRGDYGPKGQHEVLALGGQRSRGRGGARGRGNHPP